jgi:hypothetical protein
MDPSQLLNLNIATQAIYNTNRYQVSKGEPGIQGDKGDTGATGPAGTSGSSTNTGSTGLAGSSTSTGATGVTGPTGIHGTATSTGATGTQGSATNTGATGTSGTPGFSGATGATGIQGSATNTGATGTSGTPGAPGFTGPTGTQGAATNTGATGPQGIPGTPGSSGGGAFGIIKVPSSTSNFNFSAGVSTLPSSFGTYNPGSATDGFTFTITLNSSYSPSNLPFFNVTTYVYSATAGYINCQRQMGTQSGVAAAYITINPAVTTITLNYINKTNFPYTVNDSNGYALYICFNVYN